MSFIANFIIFIGILFFILLAFIGLIVVWGVIKMALNQASKEIDDEHNNK